MKVLAALLAPLLLAGCITTQGPGSVSRGECKVFHAPKYAVRGATQHDQDWIDPTIEGGVGACKWKRPAPRPAAWDGAKAAPVAAAKRPGLLKRVRATLGHLHHRAPVATPAAPVEPRSAVDELLHPADAK